MVKQAKIAFLTWPTVSKVAFVIDWTVIWRAPSSFFGKISSAIFLSGNAFLRNIRKQAKKKKKKGRRAWKIWLRRLRQSFSRSAAKLPKKGLRWSQNSNYSNRKQCSAYKGRKNGVASSLFFEETNLECWEKRKVKVTENCVENTDFAYAAASRPGHMPRQLPARLSGIRSIHYTLWEITGISYGNKSRPDAHPNQMGHTLPTRFSWP